LVHVRGAHTHDSRSGGRWRVCQSPTRMNVFRGTAWYYARYRPGYPPALIEALARAAGLDAGSRVLDLACGTGPIAIPLAAYVDEVVALDREPEMLDELRAAAPTNVVVLEGDAGGVDGDLGEFELVTIGRALHWLGGAAYLDHLEPLTSQVALLGDRISDSEAFTTVLEVAEEIAGERPQASGWLVSYDSALANSAFSEVSNLTVEDERTWTKDSLVGWALSTSFASSERLGERRDEFEGELRARLKPRYVERVRVEALLGRRP
jgi:SAM-dependent methyltransferase